MCGLGCDIFFSAGWFGFLSPWSCPRFKNEIKGIRSIVDLRLMLGGASSSATFNVTALNRLLRSRLQGRLRSSRFPPVANAQPLRLRCLLGWPCVPEPPCGVKENRGHCWKPNVETTHGSTKTVETGGFNEKKKRPPFLFLKILWFPQFSWIRV